MKYLYKNKRENTNRKHINKNRTENTNGKHLNKNKREKTNKFSSHFPLKKMTSTKYFLINELHLVSNFL